jgi:hypothetical protein
VGLGAPPPALPPTTLFPKESDGDNHDDAEIVLAVENDDVSEPPGKLWCRGMGACRRRDGANVEVGGEAKLDVSWLVVPTCIMFEVESIVSRAERDDGGDAAGAAHELVSIGNAEGSEWAVSARIS